MTALGAILDSSPLAPFVAATIVLVLSTLAGFGARRWLPAALRRLVEKSAWEGDDVIVESLRGPMPAWFFLAGAYVASRIVPLPAGLARGFETLLLSAAILSATLWAAHLGAKLLEIAGAPGGSRTAAATGVVRQVVRFAVLATGLLVLLGTLGISVTPVLTTLGVGGLAVALGLQETLANLFAGMQITLARAIRVGDFVKLESGEEGYVEDIHWRTTRVRTLPNNFVLVPNSRLAQSVVTNYHLPSKDMAVLVEVGVHYASDLDRVERVTCDVGRSIMRTVPGGVPEFDPFIRFHTFADSSVNLTVILRAKEFTDSYLVKHEFMKALTRAYRNEGIIIPFPIRAINVEQEKTLLDGAGASR